MAARRPKTADDYRIEKLLREYLHGDTLCPKCGLHMMNTKEGAGKKYGICENCYHDAKFAAMADNYRQKLQEREYNRVRKRHERARKKAEAEQLVENEPEIVERDALTSFDDRYYL